MRRTLIVATTLLLAACSSDPEPPRFEQPGLATRGPSIEVAGSSFRDANRNETLEPYEDWRLGAAQRADDLVSRMTLEEKAGAMMHGTAPTAAPTGAPGSGHGYDLERVRRIVIDQHVTSLITRLSPGATELAEQNNRLQEVAAEGRLGIPLTISTDPRHHFQFVEGASVVAGGFSKWPEPLGLAAIGDTGLTKRFGEVARAEYRAVGIQMGLSPQADLATEPRWSRINGTFGEDPERAHDQVRAYVEGFQGRDDGVTREGVALVVKHWAGYGAAVDGFDAHNYYGRFARLDDAFEQHVRPFEGAFAVQVAGVMPTYSILDVAIEGQPIEKVGGGFNRPLLINLLRGRHGYDGIILSDWAITRDCGENCRTGAERHTFADIATSWGLEDATVEERFVRGVEAGLDQFGGTEQSEMLVEAVRSGALAASRLDESVRRIMRLKFELGLFENPFVEPAAAAGVVGSADAQRAASRAQSRSLVVLENRNGTLPLARGTRVHLRGVEDAAARTAGLEPVDLAQAQVAIVRAGAPHEMLHPNFFFGGRQHEGRLDFHESDADYQAILEASAKVPTVVTIYLDRPAILTRVRDRVAALVGNFGVSDEALLAGLTGAVPPEGKLPFELPSSMADVEAQSPGRPHDTANPLYEIGYGLTVGGTD